MLKFLNKFNIKKLRIVWVEMFLETDLKVDGLTEGLRDTPGFSTVRSDDTLGFLKVHSSTEFLTRYARILKGARLT